MSKIILLLILIGVQAAQGATCKPVENEDYVLWEAQKNWVGQTVTPSAENPEISYPVFEKTSGELIIGDLEQDIVPFKANMTMSFETAEFKERFERRCRNQTILTSPVQIGNGNTKRDGSFKIELPILPSLGSEIMNPIAAAADTFAVSLWLDAEARAVSSNFPKTASETAEIFENIWNTQLANKVGLAESFNGTVELKFDTNGALACDFLTGKAKIKFRHYGQNPETLVREDLTSQEELEMLSDKVTKAQPKTDASTMFAAGLVAAEAQYHDATENSFETLEPVILTLYESKSGGNLNFDSSDFQCAMDHTAQFRKEANSFTNVFEVEIQEGL